MTKNLFLEKANHSWTADSIRCINTPTVAARSTFFYVQEAGDFHTFPPYYTERANLDSFLLLLTLHGQGLLEIGQNIIPCKEGQIFFISCMDHHRYKTVSKTWDFLWLHFNGPAVLGYQKMFAQNEPILSLDDPSTFEQLLRQILKLTISKVPQGEILVSGLIADLMTKLLLASGSQQTTQAVPDSIRAATKLIDSRFTEPLDLTTLSESVHLSRYHFAREFRRYTGMPPGEYLIVRRIDYAKERLRYTSDSTEIISTASGFGSVSHFIELFKRHEGCTPLQYRKHWTEYI